MSPLSGCLAGVVGAAAYAGVTTAVSRVKASSLLANVRCEQAKDSDPNSPGQQLVSRSTSTSQNLLLRQSCPAKLSWPPESSTSQHGADSATSSGTVLASGTSHIVAPEATPEVPELYPSATAEADHIATHPAPHPTSPQPEGFVTPRDRLPGSSQRYCSPSSTNSSPGRVSFDCIVAQERSPDHHDRSDRFLVLRCEATSMTKYFSMQTDNSLLRGAWQPIEAGVRPAIKVLTIDEDDIHEVIPVEKKSDESQACCPRSIQARGRLIVPELNLSSVHPAMAMQALKREKVEELSSSVDPVMAMQALKRENSDIRREFRMVTSEIFQEVDRLRLELIQQQHRPFSQSPPPQQHRGNQTSFTRQSSSDHSEITDMDQSTEMSQDRGSEYLAEETMRWKQNLISTPPTSASDNEEPKREVTRRRQLQKVAPLSACNGCEPLGGRNGSKGDWHVPERRFDPALPVNSERAQINAMCAEVTQRLSPYAVAGTAEHDSNTMGSTDFGSPSKPCSTRDLNQDDFPAKSLVDIIGDVVLQQSSPAPARRGQESAEWPGSKPHMLVPNNEVSTSTTEWLPLSMRAAGRSGIVLSKSNQHRSRPASNLRGACLSAQKPSPLNHDQKCVSAGR